MLRFGFRSKTIYVIFALLLAAGCGADVQPQPQSQGNNNKQIGHVNLNNGGSSVTSGGASDKDRILPETRITSPWLRITKDNSATVSFEGSDNVKVAGFACRLDAAAWASCTSPLILTGIVDGRHTFQVRATDSSGNVDPTPASTGWTVDTVSPETSLDSRPTAVTSTNFVLFRMSNEGGSSYECSLDGGNYVRCATPTSYLRLVDGAHTFNVRAIDAAGNVDATPATANWTVDTTPPDTSIVSAPTALTNTNSASFVFSSVGGSSFECQLDGSAFATCTSSQNYSGLADGAHAFNVRAIDAAGNVDATPATANWTIDTGAPNTSFVSGASGTVSSTSNSFAFSCDQGVCTYQCALNAGAFAGCGNPYGFVGQADGSYTLQVRATDAAGNTDASPAVRSWTVDSTPPIVTITDGPASVTDVTTATSAHFVFTCNESGCTTYCSLDSVTAATCSSQVDVTGLTAGTHTFAVTGVDLAGNATTSVTSQTWTVLGLPVWQSIPGGSFGMGDALDGLSDAPVHTVTISAFEMMSYEVSNGTYADCAADGACTAPGSPASYSGRNPYYGNAAYANYPVVNVDWQQSANYCTWAGDRLPSEAEWEYAARGGLSGMRFPWGNTIDCNKANYYTTDTFAYDVDPYVGNKYCATPGDTTQGGSYPVNGYGLFDMTGNVYEWVNDRYDSAYYSSSPVTDPQGSTTGTNRVVRGGGLSGNAADARVAYRNNISPTYLYGNVGFRCVRDYPVETTVHPATVSSTASTNVAFELSCNKANCSYFCNLDNAGWQSCTSPVTYGNLMSGSHWVEVTAMVANGLTDATPAVWNWDIDAKGNLWQSVPGSTYSMGDALDGISDAPVHSVTLTTFAMMSHEVTNGTYEACVTAGSCTVPGNLTSYSGRNPYYGNATYADYPVIYVDWNQASAYCSWAGGRLPTEAQWEYAARGGLAGKRFPWGDTIDCSKANYYASPATAGGSYTYDTNSSTGACVTPNDTTQVGRYAANGYGLYDMAGNVWEWINDWYGSYPSSPVTDPQGPTTGSNRVFRSGDFRYFGYGVRVAYRNSVTPTGRYSYIGFRCAR